MSEVFGMRVEGLRELQERLNALGEDVQTKVSRAAVRAGAVVLRDETRARAPVETGLLRDNIIATRSRNESNPGHEVWQVKMKRGVHKYANTRPNRRKRRAGKKFEDAGPAFYAAWIEFGHYWTPRGKDEAPEFFVDKKGRKRKVSVSRGLKFRRQGQRKWIPPRPFFRPAFEVAKEAATEAIVSRLTQRIERAER